MAALAVAAFVVATLADERGPVPPCGGQAPRPAYASDSARPAVAIWDFRQIDWRPPACTGWERQQDGVLIAVAVDFTFASKTETLLARFGGISALKGLRYWSVSENGWRTLITDAAALEGQDPTRRRGDFALKELRPGATLFFAQSDNRSSAEVVYRMEIKEAGQTRIVVAVENVSPVKEYMLTLFAPGDLKSLHFLDRAGPSAWRYYGLAFARESAATRLILPRASIVNRAKALYAHLAGVAPAP
jgi:hypothetical protein